MTRHQGFTLVELLVTIIVSGILLAIAIPSFINLMDKRRLVGAADNLLADMRFAQSEAVKTNVPVVITFTTLGASWTYSMNTTPGGTSSFANYKGSSLDVSNAVKALTPDSMTFNPKRNTIEPTPAAVEKMVTITSARGQALSLEVTPNSAMRLCTTTGLSGYPACT